MKKLLLTGLTTLVMTSAMLPAAFAESNPRYNPNFPMQAQIDGMYVSPYNLVFLAYQGLFENEGIQGGNALVVEYRAGRVTPERLVKTAVGMNRLSMETLNNRGYLNAVRGVLENLDRN